MKDEVLDLCLGRAFIEMHGSLMNLDSGEEAGTSVTFTLPVYQANENA